MNEDATKPMTPEAVEAELARCKRGAKTLGEIVDKQCRDVLDVTGLHHLINEDGDGPWDVVWMRLHEMRDELASLQESTIGRERLRGDSWRDRAQEMTVRAEVAESALAASNDDSQGWLPEWLMDHRMATVEVGQDPNTGEDVITAELAAPGEPGDLVTSWTGATEAFAVGPDGTRPTADLAHQPETIHRPAIPLTAPAHARTLGGGSQLFIDREMPYTRYMALLGALDAAGLLPAGTLDAAYAEGYTAVIANPEGQA